jgi:hypothetical protein
VRVDSIQERGKHVSMARAHSSRGSSCGYPYYDLHPPLIHIVPSD